MLVAGPFQRSVPPFRFNKWFGFRGRDNLVQLLLQGLHVSFDVGRSVDDVRIIDIRAGSFKKEAMAGDFCRVFGPGIVTPNFQDLDHHPCTNGILYVGRFHGRRRIWQKLSK